MRRYPRSFSPSFISLAGTAVVALFGIALAQDGPETVQRGSKRFTQRVVASGLANPWEVTWGPDGYLWVTERTGKRISRIHPATGEKIVAATIAEVSAPGGQDGLLGLALHPELGKGTGRDFVFALYTYQDKAKGPDPNVADPASPFRFLYGKVVRLRYSAATQTLYDPVSLITGLPAGDDHNGGRLKFGPDNKLYFTTGDQGHNQFGNACRLIQSQRTPTASELRAKDYSSYMGKSLRMNLDGTVPADNPKLNGVVSHVFTYGHRNPQGLDIGANGVIYSSEHGPKTDDEVNVLTSGGNYGWPHVAGLKDDKAYVYARWADSSTPCSQLRFNDLAIPPSVPFEPESAFTKPFVNPLATMFTVPTGHNFADPACKGVDFICWPTVGVSGVEYYANKGTGIPGWDHVLLVTTLKRGSLYVLPLKADGKTKAGYFSRYFQSENRYRDTAVSADGRTIFLATDVGGVAAAKDTGTTSKMENPGVILAYTYAGEGGAEEPSPAAGKSAASGTPAVAAAPILTGGTPPAFTSAQVAAGKTAYAASCSVCHGSTLTNGAYGTPLAGEYFRGKWSRRSVRAFYDRARTTMPPSHPGSLPAETYANLVAFILDANGMKAGSAALDPASSTLDNMAIQ